ncbi:MAG: nucleoid-associated protein, YbaB/EbfC family [Planctomycetes bacterium RBG_16_64_12]|nr:MAG: nucleoid-associated protein, YbaB/EbfC family [Planctomycetes bacterium RBG_16_64_12]
MFKGLAGLTSLMKQANEIRGRMQGLNEELRNRRATGSAGGGMVEVELNGLLEVLRCHVDKQLIEQGDCEMIEDLVATAVNQAVAKGKQLHVEAMKSLTGGLDVPGLESALGNFLGENAPDST